MENGAATIYFGASKLEISIGRESAEGDKATLRHYAQRHALLSHAAVVRICLLQYLEMADSQE